MNRVVLQITLVMLFTVPIPPNPQRGSWNSSSRPGDHPGGIRLNSQTRLCVLLSHTLSLRVSSLLALLKGKQTVIGVDALATLMFVLYTLMLGVALCL